VALGIELLENSMSQNIVSSAIVKPPASIGNNQHTVNVKEELLNRMGCTRTLTV
jgi:chorismate synthase